MTSVIIDDILPLTQAIAVGSQTVYSTDWTANFSTDVVVYSRPTNTVANDATQILDPSLYTVAFIGSGNIVQVTLINPSTAGDVVTITRMTPADRENLYTNTNFTPSMLNNDFGILTLVDQQAQLVNQQIGPRYNYSAIIQPITDTILPILPANYAWVKNSNNTAFLGVLIGTAASASATNPSLQYVSSANGPFTVGHVLLAGDTLGTVVDSGSFAGLGTVTQIDTGTGLTGGPITTTGTISFVEISANSLWANTTGSTAVPAVTPLSNFLLSANNLSDLENVATAVSNLGLTIGTNVEAWSAILDEVAAGTYTGSTSITTLGTITTGTWQGTLIGLAYGGTNSNLTASAGGIVYSGSSSLGILAGTTTAGQLLLSGDVSAPTWSTTTYPSTNAINTIIYASSANVMAALATADNGVLVTNGTGVPSISTTLPSGLTIPGYQATITPSALTEANDTNVTLTLGGTPATALLQAVSITAGWAGELAVARGGTGLASTVANQILYSSSTNTIAGLATANNSVLATSGTGVPSLTTTLPTAVQIGVNSLNSGTSASSSTFWRGDGTWSAPSGSGTVNSGTANQLAYYPASTTAVSGLTGVNSAGLLTNGSGVPGWVAFTGTGAPVLGTGPTLTNPIIPASLYDHTGNQMLGFQSFNVGTWSNAIQINNAVSGSNPGFKATGNDTNIILNLSGTGTGGVTTQGTGTNNNAAAGYIGEVITANVQAASALSLVNNTSKDVISITLTAGDWDVYGNIFFSASISATGYQAWVNTTSATSPDTSMIAAIGGLGASSFSGLVTPTLRVLTSGTQTVYLSGLCSFGTGSSTFCGTIFARRRR